MAVGTKTMNRTQKIAMFYIVLMPFWFAAILYLAIEVAVFKTMPEGFVAQYGPLIVLFVVMFSFLAWTLKRQSPGKSVPMNEMS